jgi:hypothetical protein
MPQVKLFEKVGIHVEEVKRRRIGQADDFHVAEQQEQVVQFSRLTAQFALVVAVGHAFEEIADVAPPRHGGIVSGVRYQVSGIRGIRDQGSGIRKTCSADL